MIPPAIPDTGNEIEFTPARGRERTSGARPIPCAARPHVSQPARVSPADSPACAPKPGGREDHAPLAPAFSPSPFHEVTNAR